MKGDFSKDTFRKKKHFHDVRMQQGRVMLDTDWNEQADIAAHRVETGTADIIGNAGAPMHYAGFEIIPVDGNGNPANPGANLKISEGRYYMDGILCENESGILFADQPDFDKTALPTATGRYIFYLDAWQRHISVLEDPEIREVALGGPDTTTRSKTVWQVKFIKGTNDSTCADLLPAAVTDPSTGQLKARSELPDGTDNPCGLETSGGYRRPENQLYRVEIHKGGATRASATFKWSRDNGSVEVKWESIDASNSNNLLVSTTGRDELLGFKSGDWIELIDDRTDLMGLPGVLVQLLKVDNNVLTIDPATINDPDDPAATKVILSTKNPRIRRWDSAGGELKLNTNNNTWIPLEDGVEVNFKEGTFKTGDYWLIPARTAIADVEWPRDNAKNPLFQPRQGIWHHFAKLAILDLASPVGGALGWAPVSDCRPEFPPLTELTSLYYIGGSGQEAMPHKPLPDTLKVGVSNGHWPVAGAKVKFEILPPAGGTLNLPGGIAETGADGIAECNVALGAVTPDLIFRVKASLLDAAGNIAPDHLPVIFNSSFSIAENVAYASKCNNWPGQAPNTVAKALDELCERRANSRSCHFTIGRDGDFKTLEEAIERLNKKHADVSLCFMPGEHEINDDIRMISKQMSFKTLHISGLAARITMNAKIVELVADKLSMLGLTLMADLDMEKGSEKQVVLSAGEIDMEYCTWLRGGFSEVPYIIIHRQGTIFLRNNKFLAWFSLVLANGVQGLIESNVISYLLLQNGEIDPFGPVPFGWVDAEMKNKILADILESQDKMIKMTTWVLTIRGNFIGALITDIKRQFPQDVYQNLFISENIFQFNNNSFIAKYLNVINNQFLFEDPDQKKPVLAFILGFNLIVMGNSGATVKARTNQGRMVGTIDAIVLSMIRGAGIGNDQILNLVHVNG